MALPVVSTGLMMCSFGVAPSTLNVIPTGIFIENNAAATVMDNVPMMNIPPFGMCTSLANPTVAAATAAALGVLTPMPCVPATAAPWVPGSPTVLLGNKPALNNSSQCMCSYGGVITISFGGAMTEVIP